MAVPCLKSLVVRNMGVSAVSSHQRFRLHLQRRGTLPGGSSPAPETGDRQEAGRRRVDGRGNVAAPPLWGRGGSCPSEGRGRQAKRESGQALLQGCHPAALPSNTRPGSKPRPYAKTDQAEIFVTLGVLFDYRSESCDAETPPLPSTCTQFRGLCKDPSIPLHEPCTLSLS